MRYSMLVYLTRMGRTLLETVEYLTANPKEDPMREEIVKNGRQMLDQIRAELERHQRDLKSSRPTDYLRKAEENWRGSGEECTAAIRQFIRCLPQEVRYQVRAVFFAELGEKWDSMESVYRYMRDDPRFDPVVVLTPVFRQVQDKEGEVKKEVIYKDYSKLTGVMRVGGDELELFRALVNKYAKTSLKQYFLNAWIENLKLLPCWEADIKPFQFYTFNKPEEYYQVQSTDIDVRQDPPEVQMIEPSALHGIEEFDSQRAERLQKEILGAGCWTVPVIVAKKTNLVLDGQHRLEVAKRLGLKQIPAIFVDYGNVSLWSLRKEIRIDQKRVERTVLRDKTIYPYKTVKHKFSFKVPNICVALSELRET